MKSTTSTISFGLDREREREDGEETETETEWETEAGIETGTEREAEPGNELDDFDNIFRVWLGTEKERGWRQRRRHVYYCL